MEQLEKMKSVLSDDMRLLLDNRIHNMLRFYEKNKKTIISELIDKINSLNTKDSGRIIISYLRSSYVTRSNRFKIAFYTGEPFVEMYPQKIYFNMTPILEGIDEDVNQLVKILYKQFINVFSWYQEEIRRLYFGQVYERSEILFSHLLQEINVKIVGTGIANDVYFGEEMGKVKFIGTIGG